MADKIKVLIVDDSALFRKVISDILQSDPLIEVVGTANNGKSAVIKAQQLDPDVITMDIEMPIMDGLAALKEIVSIKPKPVIMMSVLTQYGAEATFKALDMGAVDFVPKPSSVLTLSNEELGDLLISKVKNVAGSRVRVGSENVQPESAEKLKKSDKPSAGKIFEKGSTSSRIVGIGTSTGGPSALLRVFQDFPENFPSPVVVVQHMPEGFTRAFSERLNNNSTLKVKEAEDGDKLLPGHGFVAPGHSHIAVEGKEGNRYLRVYQSDKVSGHRPSIDVLFNSMAASAGKECVSVIMTGMGRDGAEGMLKIHEKGGYTIAQDEKTSVVFGMNRVAVQLGAVHEIVPLHEITKKIVEHI
ncbi:MAG TPA: chemotaxis response regulator protein-glutamate methylesterase [Spirochaetota bacterium]|nr:chemotaxis response regulator protein-glutamate methylesterase [Spirochaetota bacterium]HPI89673.1 chemotaxis response regulator protein-glutamate methylesterase [Spirochaetota bacterium]HPR49501.1 chemotaxis response regulator protein-glutamate methylesterase [Spirochaetota bacterium]